MISRLMLNSAYIITKLTEWCLKNVLHLGQDKLYIVLVIEVPDDVTKSQITLLFVNSSIYILHICKQKAPRFYQFSCYQKKVNNSNIRFSLPVLHFWPGLGRVTHTQTRTFCCPQRDTPYYGSPNDSLHAAYTILRVKSSDCLLKNNVKNILQPINITLKTPLLNNNGASPVLWCMTTWECMFKVS